MSEHGFGKKTIICARIASFAFFATAWHLHFSIGGDWSNWSDWAFAIGGGIGIIHFFIESFLKCAGSLQKKSWMIIIIMPAVIVVDDTNILFLTWIIVTIVMAPAQFVGVI